MDGVDASLIETDGESLIKIKGSLNVPYEESFKLELIENISNKKISSQTELKLTQFHADAVSKLIEKENLVDKAAKSGEYLLKSIHDLQNEFPSLVSNSRGKGLYCAFDLPSSEDRDKLAGLLLDEGSILLGSGNYSIRFRPHLNVTEDDINFGMDCFRRALNKLS